MSMIDKLLRIVTGGPKPVIDFLVPVMGVQFQGTQAPNLTDAATITPNGSNGQSFYFVATTNGVREFEVPINVPIGGFFWLTLSNTSGGALTTTTFNALYKGVPTLPATAKQRAYQFRWDGTNAFLMVQSAADVPN